MTKRYKITCRNGNTVTVKSLREAREICIHLHADTTIMDQNGTLYGLWKDNPHFKDQISFPAED